MTGDGELQEGQIWESLQPCANERLVGDHRDRRSQQAAVGLGGRRGQRSRAARRQVPRLRLGRAARRRPRLRGDARRLRALRDRHRSAEGAASPTPSRARACRSWKAWRAAIRPITSTPARRRSKDYVAAVARADVARSTRARRVSASRRSALTSRAAAGARRAGRSRSSSCSPTATSCSQMARTAHGHRRHGRRPAVGLRHRSVQGRSCPSASSSAASPSSTWCRRPAAWRCSGMLPVVHSFACFLSTRANEQIYNNATEKKKIIYTATLAGVVPGGPGHSHQSVRDISAIGSVPGLTAFEPCSEREARLAIRWAVEAERRRAPICASSTCRSICRTRCRRRTRCRSAAASRCATAPTSRSSATARC